MTDRFERVMAMDIEAHLAKLSAAHAALDAAIPELEEFEEWKKNKREALAEIQTLHREAEAKRYLRVAHEGTVEELRLEKEKLRQEIVGAQRDLAKVKAEYDAMEKKLRGSQRWNEWSNR